MRQGIQIGGPRGYTETGARTFEATARPGAQHTRRWGLRRLARVAGTALKCSIHDQTDTRVCRRGLPMHDVSCLTGRSKPAPLRALERDRSRAYLLGHGYVHFIASHLVWKCATASGQQDECRFWASQTSGDTYTTTVERAWCSLASVYRIGDSSRTAVTEREAERTECPHAGEGGDAASLAAGAIRDAWSGVGGVQELLRRCPLVWKRVWPARPPSRLATRRGRRGSRIALSFHPLVTAGTGYSVFAARARRFVLARAPIGAKKLGWAIV